MRIVFMGSPEFALPSLSILIEHKHEILSVVTVPDKPAGRGLHVTSSPAKLFALERNIPVFQPQSLKDNNFIEELKNLKPELFVIVAFKILPPEIYKIPVYGSFNLHASLLPKYRGAAPINWAVINGEKETGVTTFFLQDKIDTGNIILQARLPIGENESAGEVHDKLADIGAEVVLHTVNLISMGRAIAKPQEDSNATSAPKIFKEMCRIDWNKNAVAVHNFIRGLSPHPTAFTSHKGKKIKIYKSKIAGDMKFAPGAISVSVSRLFIGTGDGAVEILELQLEGKNKLSSEEFLRGYQFDREDLLV
ncbi:MAG: methionyl-tRNA formyltransferase [Ignavibacteriales bacterium]|nr:methionyl-tRNA formyltransferase [Ignavibacteriales bacterium]